MAGMGLTELGATAWGGLAGSKGAGVLETVWETSAGLPKLVGAIVFGNSGLIVGVTREQ